MFNKVGIEAGLRESEESVEKIESSSDIVIVDQAAGVGAIDLLFLPFLSGKMPQLLTALYAQIKEGRLLRACRGHKG